MSRKRKIRRSIESLEKQKEIHEKKIEEYDGKKDFLKEYWGGEIRRFDKKIEEQRKKLKK
ncbi:MAG: hypothetical protein AABY22_01140 [Nanoarchaeota archaeon]